MLRSALALLLLLGAGCGDLTKVAPPPVPLSAIDAQAAVGDGPLASLTGGVRLVRALPQSTLFSLHLPDIGGTLERFRKTSLYRLFTSPELQQMLGPVSGSFGMIQGGPADMNDVMKSLNGEFVLAVEDIGLDTQGVPDSVRLIAGITVSGAETHVAQLLDMAAMFAGSKPGTRIEKGNVAGTNFQRIVDGKLVLEMALHRNALLVGVGRDTATRAITRLNSREERCLLDNVGYRRGMERCGDPRDALRIHVDLANVLKKFGKMLPKQAADMLSALGVDQFQALTAVARIEDRDFVISTFLDSPGGTDLLTSLLSEHSADRQFFHRIPADATSFSLFSVDGAKLLGHLRKKLAGDMAAKLESALDDLARGGFDLEKDALSVFGPRCALVNLPHGGTGDDPMRAIWNHLLGSALIIDVRDPDGAQRALRKLPKSRHDLRRREYEIDAVPAVTYHFKQSQLPGEFAPSYAYVDDFLIVTVCEGTLRRMLAPRPPAVAERFREMFRDTPQGVATMSYDDTRRGLDVMTSAFLTALQARLGPMGSMEHEQSPTKTLASVTRDFNPTLSYTVADHRGVFMHTQSPTAGFGGMGGLTGLMMVSAVAIPNFAAARQAANEAAAVTTLRKIAVAQETFRSSAVRDEDGDGKGEFGFLSDLTANYRPGDRESRQRTALVQGLLRDDKGNFVSNGYRFRVYLPAEDGSPIGEHLERSRLQQVDGDLAEAIMIVVAWPEIRPATGRSAFLLDAMGRIYACADGPYGASNPPRPDALCSQTGNLASAPIRRKTNARDGFRWDLVK